MTLKDRDRRGNTREVAGRSARDRYRLLFVDCRVKRHGDTHLGSGLGIVRINDDRIRDDLLAHDNRFLYQRRSALTTDRYIRQYTECVPKNTTGIAGRIDSPRTRRRIGHRRPNQLGRDGVLRLVRDGARGSPGLPQRIGLAN